MSQQDNNDVVCSAGCKRSMQDDDTARLAGWESLSITSRWRCPACKKELVAAREYHLPPTPATPNEINLGRVAMFDSLDIAFGQPKE